MKTPYLENSIKELELALNRTNTHKRFINNKIKEFKAIKVALSLDVVVNQRELFDAILDFTESLPMVTDDYDRDVLWNKYLSSK